MSNVRDRLRAVPIFSLEFVEPWKDIANASARKPRRSGCLSEARRTQEENRDCSQSMLVNAIIVFQSLTLEGMERGGGGSVEPLPSTFDTIHPIYLIFDTYNELSLYFQLIETKWCLIGFSGEQNYINDVARGRHLGFSIFQIFFYIRIEH